MFNREVLLRDFPHFLATKKAAGNLLRGRKRAGVSPNPETNFKLDEVQRN